jgi:hypothetical protein
MTNGVINQTTTTHDTPWKKQKRSRTEKGKRKEKGRREKKKRKRGKKD